MSRRGGGPAGAGWWLWLLLLSAAAGGGGCGSEDGPAFSDAGTVGGGGGARGVGGAGGDRDAGADAAPRDVAIDVAGDTARDVATDAGLDAGGIDAADLVDAPVDGVGGDSTLDGDTVSAMVRIRADQFTGTIDATSFAGEGTSWSRAVATAAGVVVAANPDSNSVTVLSGTPLAVRAEIAVGRDPRMVAITDDGHYAVVVNRGDATVSIVDLTASRELYYLEVRPLSYAAVIAAGRIHVTEWATGSLVSFDPVTRQRVARAAVAPFPAGIAHCGPPTCGLASGRGLLVTHFYDGRLSVVDPTTLATIRTISTGADTNASQQVAIAPDGKRAYLPQTRSFADNPIRQFDTTVFPVVNVVDLASFALLNSARVTLDTADQPVGLPFAVEFLANGTQLVVANAASDDLSIIDLGSGNKVAHVEVGSNPQGIAVGGGNLLINQFLDGALRIIDPRDLSRSTSVSLTTSPLPAELLRGKRLFWSANRADLARDQWMSCATCHFDGFHDARTWRSFPDGIRNTTALFNLADTLPLHWSGDLNEIHDVEATVRFIQAGKGLAPAPQIDTLGAALTGASADLDALAAFLVTLRAPASPYGEDEPAITRGRAVFDRLTCVSCHSGEHFTDRKNHDVGTGDPVTERNSHGRGTTFDTPTLRALWLTAPFLHDGSAPTLEAVFERPAHTLGTRTTSEERGDLITYLRSL